MLSCQKISTGLAGQDQLQVLNGFRADVLNASILFQFAIRSFRNPASTKPYGPIEIQLQDKNFRQVQSCQMSLGGITQYTTSIMDIQPPLSKQLKQKSSVTLYFLNTAPFPQNGKVII